MTRGTLHPEQAGGSWSLELRGFHPLQERAWESLLAFGNGYIGNRASFPEGNPASSPGTFIAGVFDAAEPEPDRSDLVLAPDWLSLRIQVAGETIFLGAGDVVDHVRRLDLRRAVWTRDWRHCDPAGRITSVRFLQLVSMADRYALLQRLEVTPENYTADITIETRIDARRATRTHGAFDTALAAEPALAHTTQLAVLPSDAPVLPLATQQTGTTMAFASGTAPEFAAEARLHDLQADAVSGQVTAWRAEYGRTYRLDRLVSVYTSRDCASPEASARTHLQRLAAGGADALIVAHERRWTERWHSASIELEGDPAIERALRLAAYHLISAANETDEHASIGARGLTGQAYRGHVFWDTEIFMLPFFIHTHPAAARALLMYRYHTLPAARDKARRMGYRGALHAWESAMDGREATPSELTLAGGEVVPVLCGEMEHHISADVAFATWQYWRETGDDAFFLQAGAEIMLETARFWAGRVTPGQDGAYHIDRIIGPDEYHEDVADNAYTNLMARWNLVHAERTAEILAERWPEKWQEVSSRLRLSTSEVAAWPEIAGGLVVLQDENGLIEQFGGYHGLEEIDLTAFARQAVPVWMALGHRRLGETKILKQADVLMALALLWDDFPAKVHQANFKYYEPRTAHGSSLSPGVHALFAARLGDLGPGRAVPAPDGRDRPRRPDGERSRRHAHGGTRQPVAGCRLRIPRRPAGDDSLSLCPRLPARWKRLATPLAWRGRGFYVDASTFPASTKTTLESGGPLVVEPVGEPSSYLPPGSAVRFEGLGRRVLLTEGQTDE